MNELSEVGLALNKGIGDVHLAAKLGKPEHKFDGVDIGSDDDDLGLLLFDKAGHVLQTELQHSGLLIVGLGARLLGSGSVKQPLRLLLFVLGRVLLEELEEVQS